MGLRKSKICQTLTNAMKNRVNVNISWLRISLKLPLSQKINAIIFKNNNKQGNPMKVISYTKPYPYSVPIGIFCVLFCMSALAATETSESYPNQTIKLEVGFAPGATTDTVARLLAQKLAAQMNGSIVVENKTGANGNIAAEFVAKSKPNGYTLLFNTMAMILSAAADQKLGFNPFIDLIPIARVASSPNLMVLHPSVAADNLKDFTQYVRSSAGQSAYSSAGTGSPSHLGMVLWLQSNNLTASHVPYKGSGPALLDVVAGHIPYTMAGQSGVLPMLKDHRVKVVAITSLQRSPLLPSVPTIAESLPGFEMVIWLGLMAPIGTPSAIINRLNTEVLKAVQDQEMKLRLSQEGADPSHSSSKDYAQYIRSEFNRWSGVFKKGGITLSE